VQVEARERDGVRIVECVGPIAQVDDALGLVAACVEQGSTRLLLESRHLPADFFELRTRFAGEFLQKLQNYRIRLAGVFPPEAPYGERFRELLSEAKRGRGFRSFESRSEAEDWLASG
jgi:hypothetical protein